MTATIIGNSFASQFPILYYPHFGTYRTVTAVDDGSPGHTLADITATINLNTGARWGEGHKIRCIVKGAGTTGTVLQLWGKLPGDSTWFLVEEKAATGVDNAFVTFEDLMAITYKIMATTLPANAELIAGGTQ